MERHFVDRFRETAKRFPHRTALHYEDNQYTYRELDILSERLSAFLTRQGIGRGCVVSILIPRCEYMAITALGVLKTGAAYEPLDVSHPKKRIRSMIDEADASLVITAREYAPLTAEVCGECGRKIFYIEDIAQLPDEEEAARPMIKDDDTFVILFTSGSTGEPKGILLTHGNIASLTDWYLPFYKMNESSRVGQYASFVFDMSIEGLLLPLAAGASVHIIPDAMRTDLYALKQFFDENEITHCSMTTQMGRQFALLMGEKVKTLKHLTVGGEALKAISPPESFTLYNGYGPTETTLLVSIYPLHKTFLGDVPLGSPLSEVEIYILNEDGERVADGETGEICIAGPHVAKGYLNRPDLTEKVFTVNPFSEDPAFQRLYHTGDLARYVADPEDSTDSASGPHRVLEYVGRADRQVKIRGFRIEPGEIESLLLRSDQIRDALVTPLQLGNQKVLCAYYLSDQPLDEKVLKDLILQEKPSYMLPSFFVHLKEFPLNTNGKLDLQRLPGPGAALNSDIEVEIKRERKKVPPATETEKQLAGLVSDILHQQYIGREDSFYQLGGSSITAASLLYRIFEEMHVRVSTRDILEYPQIWQLAERIDALAGKNGSDEIAGIIPVHNDRGEYVVSTAQERIYTAQNMLARGDSTYLLYLTIRTDGRFDREKVKDILCKLFIRHESLRTSFHLTDRDGLVQRIRKPEESWVTEIVERSNTDTLSREIVLDQAPLFTWRYQENALSFCWHHIISDGSSCLLFAREFVHLYNGGTLEALSIHQKDCAAFERRQSVSALHGKLREDWRRICSDFTDAEDLALPADGSLQQERMADHYHMILTEQLSERIDQFCSENSITTYMFLLSVFSLLLSWYSGQEKIVLGTIMNGRDEPETRQLQGMFANTVPLFLNVPGNCSLSDYLKNISDKVFSALDMQNFPLEEIASDFEKDGGYRRTAHGHLLFDVLYIMQNMEQDLPDIDGKHTWIEEEAGDRAMYDLSLETERRVKGYHCDFEYDRALFSADSIRFLGRHFQALIESCLSSGPEKDTITLSELSVIDKAERELLLKDFQPGHDLEESFSAEYKELKPVTLLFAERVEEDPDKTAVIFGDTFLSYKELWNRSTALSGLIMSQIDNAGQPDRDREEKRIAIIAERGLSMIISIWAVLQSGCAYVPISPTYPGERITYLLRDCKPSLIISCLSGEGSLSDKPGLSESIVEGQLPVISLPEPFDPCRMEQMTDTCKKDSGKVRVKPEDPAYMIYTSGTTGEPKAVVIEHRQLAALLLAYKDIYRLSKQDTVLQFAEYVFDQSVWDIFHILTAGGSLCLIPQEIAKDPEGLTNYCMRKNVTVFSMTPAFLRLLDPDAFPTLRLLDVGGEAPDKDLLFAWSKDRTVFNTYGPTETTVNATSFLFSDKGSVRSFSGLPEGKVPIGKTVPGSRTYILRGEDLCGVGVPGELCIAGAQVARGYYGREELTKEKFTEDPFFHGPMYRSGDLARVLPDGNIEFMGRIDDQVKLRGFRIELKEIESVIRRLAGIEDAIVLIQKAEEGEDTLCGYYTTADNRILPQNTLRDQLEQILPQYMVPAFLMQLGSLPLTINGKVNVRVLPKPERISDKGFEKAQGREELDLSEAFLKVLKLPRISVSDDFLAVGGDSIKAIRIASLLHDKGYQLNGSDLMRYRTIKKLASFIQTADNKEDSFEYEEFTQVVPTPVMRQFEAEKMSNPNWYNQSALLLLVNNPGQKELETALNSLIHIHGMLRMAVPKQDGDIQIRNPVEIPRFTLPVYEEAGEEKREEICSQLQKEMSLQKGVVMKAALFINKDNEKLQTRLFLAFHHYVIDEVSWGILLGDLDDILNGTDLMTRKRTVSFGEWSKELWAYRDSEAFLPEKAYWESVHKKLVRQNERRKDWLTGYQRQTEVPVKREYADLSLALPAKVKDGLLQYARNCKTGLDTILLAGLALAIKELDGVDAVTVQLESHGRGTVPAKNAVGEISEALTGSDHHYLTDRTVGWFTAVYPLVLDVASSDTEQIILTKEARMSVPNLGIGYGLLYEDLNEQGGIVFNYLGEERDEAYENIRFLHEPIGNEIDPAVGDPDTISVDIRGEASGLLLQCRYDTVFDSERIRQLLSSFEKQLMGLAGQVGDHPVYSPSDLCIGQVMSYSDWKRFTLEYDPETVSAVARLTSLQEGMLYRYMAEPDSRAYYLQDRLLIAGEWKEENFIKALNLCSIRFDALRLRFLYKDMEESWQIVLKEMTPEYVDASDLSLSEVLLRDTERGFSLEEDSPIRFTRYQEESEKSLSRDKYIGILVSAHHTVLDGWSFPIMIRTLMEYYRKLCRGMDEDRLAVQVMKDAEKSSSFADYLKDSSRINSYVGLKHWESYLGGLEDGCGLLPPSSKKEVKGSAESARRSAGKNLSKKIRNYLMETHITAGSFFGVLWAILLGFENLVSDVVFGEVVSGRNRNMDEIEDVVGMLISTVPVRVHWDMNTLADELMKKRQEDYLDMQPYEGLSLSSIGAHTGLRGRLIQTLYVYENYPRPDEEAGFRLLPLHEEIDYELGLSVEEGDDYQLSLLYDSGIYQETYISLLLDRTLHLALQIIEKPGIRVSDLERIPDQEKRSMLGQIAGSRTRYPDDTFLDQLYQQVITSPDRTALSMDGNTMSYRELWVNACVLAGRSGFRQERYIALITDRSFEMIIAMMAVMLSGAAYVPVDKDYPVERMKVILKDCNPESVICRKGILYPDGKERKELMSLFSELNLDVISDIPCIKGGYSDTDIVRFPELSRAELVRDRIAYMIYTSGTTGRPKGVEVEHKALSNLIHDNEGSFGSYRDDVVLLLFNPAFDGSVTQIFPTLAQGGCLSVIPEDRMESPEKIVDYCVRNRITVLGSTNALLRTFISSLAGRLKLRLIYTGGDEADSLSYKEYARHTRMLVNDYGPTETCVRAVSHIYQKGDEGRIPLGRPYPNKRIYIMQGDHLCGIGQKGEICVGGEGLSRGYHGRPDLTESVFKDSPFDEGRMYRTGDLGVFGTDHNLYYEGRKDSQVKIRGFRIETEEISACLKKYPGIRDAIVVPFVEEGKEPRLAAYITRNESVLLSDRENEIPADGPVSSSDGGKAEEGSEDDIDSVRVYLKNLLPHYMIPAFIIVLPSLPLTTNGKVDTKRLPKPMIRHSGQYASPKHYFEDRVASLFERILKVERAGRDDSFFELGGSSIDLMKLLSGLSGYNISAADVFSRPTVRGLGKLLRNRYLKEQEEENCILLQEGDRHHPAIYCLPPSGGMSMCYLPLLRELHYPGYIWGLTDVKYRSFGRMSLSEMENFDPGAQDQRPATLLAYKKALDGSFKEGDILLGYSQGGTIAHSLARQLEYEGKVPGRLIILEGVPFSEEEAVTYKAESQEESLRAAEFIFFGHNEFYSNESSKREILSGSPAGEISVKDALAACLKAHDEEYSEDNEGLLHAFFETYLVYRVNTCMPYVTEGKIDSEVNSILLVKEEMTESAICGRIRIQKDPWELYTSRNGKSFGIAGKMDDHLEFLSEYKNHIADCMIELIELEEQEKRDE